jgi:hypothetical protein
VGKASDVVVVGEGASIPVVGVSSTAEITVGEATTSTTEIVVVAAGSAVGNPPDLERVQPAAIAINTIAKQATRPTLIQSC